MTDTSESDLAPLAQHHQLTMGPPTWITPQHNTHNQRLPHQNNRSGFLGVSKRADGRFQAEIRVDGKKRYLGAFPTPEQASAAYVDAKRQLRKGAAL